MPENCTPLSLVNKEKLLGTKGMNKPEYAAAKNSFRSGTKTAVILRTRMIEAVCCMLLGPKFLRYLRRGLNFFHKHEYQNGTRDIKEGDENEHNEVSICQGSCRL